MILMAKQKLEISMDTFLKTINNSHAMKIATRTQRHQV